MLLFEPTIRFAWEGRCGPDWIELRRRLYDCEFIYVSRGSYQLEIAGQQHVMRKGSIAIIPPDTWHESRTPSGGYAVRHCLHFDWLPAEVARATPISCSPGEPYRRDLIRPVPVYISQFLPLVSHGRSHGGIINLVETMLSHIRRKHPLGPYLFWPVLRYLLALREERAPAPFLPGKSSHAVLTVREHIHKHYAEPQDYGDYRRLTGLTKSHLCQAFSSMVGLPPLKYLTSVRLHHACRLLQESALNISEVAAAVGIPDANYFGRLFRRKFKQSPSMFMSSAAGSE